MVAAIVILFVLGGSALMMWGVIEELGGVIVLGSLIIALAIAGGLAAARPLEPADDGHTSHGH